MLLFNMHLLWLVMMGAFMGMAAAQASCDPRTQYAKDGGCCQMCGPGTSMSNSDCENPRCDPCGEDEFQEKYTNASKCERQRYCDSHKNFEEPGQRSKTEKYNCKCKYGFHCSSEECLTCVEHTPCAPGFGVKSIGNHSYDTVCERCAPGTFSNETSWSGVCHKWTKCAVGDHEEESGTDTTDKKCASSARRHIIIIVIVVIAVVVVVILLLIYQGCIKRKAKGYFKPEPCQQQETPKMETKILMPMTPEENDDNEDSHELSSEGLTEKGNRVMQERGKEEIISRQESQLDSQEDSFEKIVS
ncbi:tumor necrosis factor receptor superfamily member 5 isoform X2 [Archocentrus centrarchus]|uniref:tumor necrosis factor receptor superfamily member 5 isoform X2 n=1 Tax=Archocentrus centrarchus TaxID=63155 RepID=UPI0011E9D273|nr:tumor necrosis factor receptor superfamily member 5-like isoform X2 [Archocentrus centrarchus]